jgi:hypothetical protein
MSLWHFLRNLLVLDFGLDIVLTLTSLSWVFALMLSQVCWIFVLTSSQVYFFILNLCLNIISGVLPYYEFWPLTLFLILLPCPESLPWHCLRFVSLSWIFALISSQVCFLGLDLCLNIVVSLLYCPGFLPWHCLKCACLSWIFALTSSQVCFIVLDFDIEMCFLILDLCLDIVLSLPPCPGF